MPQLENNKKTLLFSYTLHSGNWHNSFIFLDSLVYWATAFNNVESIGIRCPVVSLERTKTF